MAICTHWTFLCDTSLHPFSPVPNIVPKNSDPQKNIS